MIEIYVYNWGMQCQSTARQELQNITKAHFNGKEDCIVFFPQVLKCFL